MMQRGAMRRHTAVIGTPPAPAGLLACNSSGTALAGPSAETSHSPQDMVRKDFVRAWSVA